MKDNDFDRLWQTIQAHMRPGQKIRNWTVQRGYLGGVMTVVETRPNAIMVETPNALNQQVVPRADFEAVWRVWNAYKRGQVQRQEIRDLTRFSKYIISILHHLEACAEER